MAVEIPIYDRNGKCAVSYIDDEDEELVSLYRWNLRGGYARYVPGHRRKAFVMHRLVTGLIRPPVKSTGTGTFTSTTGKPVFAPVSVTWFSDAGLMEVDHRDGNRLNNQKHNLRVLAFEVARLIQSYNKRNVRYDFPGVTRCYGGQEWYGQFRHKGIRHTTDRSDDQNEVLRMLHKKKKEVYSPDEWEVYLQSRAYEATAPVLP